MTRPRRDGLPSRTPNKQKLTDRFVRGLKPEQRSFLVWDLKLRGLALAVYPTGTKVWKVIYAFGGRMRWFTIGKADAVGLDDARKLAAEVLLKVATDVDPQAERRASRSAGTFEELASRYVEECSKRKNKSWAQAERLVRKNLLPRWGKLPAASITRADAKAAHARIESPTTANQTLAAASAIFSWAIAEEIGGVKINPCQKVEHNETKSRERVLSDSEIPKFWAAFDDCGLIAATALKLILLLGQRPGEVRKMRREHIIDGWWSMPGEPVPEIGWPGTKNGESHRVWLPPAARDLLAELEGEEPPSKGFIFGSERGKPVAKLDVVMRKISDKLEVEPVTPHDLRRTHGTMITRLKFGRDAMNRIQNHSEGGIADVYDQHSYSKENMKIWETVAAKIVALAKGETGTWCRSGPRNELIHKSLQ